MMAAAAQEQAIRQIIAFARAGRFDQAALAVRQAQAGGASGPVFAALAGAVEFHRGQWGAAIPFLQIAHTAKPDDNTVRGNLAEALWRCDRAGEALALCTLAAARADRSLRLASLGAHLAQEAEDFAHAAALYRLVLAAQPEDAAAWNNLGNALCALGDWPEAVKALRKAAALTPDSLPVRLNLAQTLIEAGDPAEGEAALRAITSDAPEEPKAYYALFDALRRRGDGEGAHAALITAAALSPNDAQIQADLGQHAALLGRFAEAEAPLRTALALDPTLAQAWVAMASLLERLNREDELDPLRAQAAGIDAASLSFIDALRHKRSHRYAEALEALDAAGDDTVVPSQRDHLRGVLLDRLGRPDEAFAAFSAMNEALATDPSDPRGRGAAYRADIAQGTALITPAWRATWQAFAPPTDRPAPIFLLGFPRSGTTLLDTLLMAEPRVRVLEEEPIIAEIEMELGGVAALPSLTPDQIMQARARYFERAAQRSDLAPDSIILDKHPMHLRHGPTIARLFPESRFILALRHPCDVLLSCWLTNFRLNNAMASFLDLGDAADLYDQAFTQWQRARDVLGLHVGTVVYERLVQDAEAELRPLFEGLGLTYPGAGLDHRDAARARGTVITASYAQVTEPIYQRAAGRWRRYAAHLAPVMDRIAPWIAQWGYAHDAIPARDAQP